MSSIDDEFTMVMKNRKRAKYWDNRGLKDRELSSKSWLCHSLGLSLLAKHKLSEPQSFFAVKW